MDRAIQIYRDTFLFELDAHSEIWSELRFGDTVIALHGGAHDGRRKTGLSIQVEDIELTC